MQSVPREWLDFLRQQFPKDSRIQLTEIGGNPRPISPDSTGKLDYIDDAGQFHVKWDNGCTLALVLGEDRFSVYLPEPQTFKLYMPLTADFYGRDEWGDMSEDGEEWDGHTLMDYEGQILSALVKNRVPEENESGLMRWYGEDDSVDHKVRSAVFTVEVRNRQLWGVAECRVAGELTPEELTILKEYLGGQASDGWGEGFEQRPIEVDGGELYVHLWQPDDWSIQTEQERFAPKVAEGYALWNSCGCNSISKGCDTGWNGMGTSNTRHTAVAGLDPSGRNRSYPSSRARKGESCDGGKRPADKRQRPPNPG